MNIMKLAVMEGDIEPIVFNIHLEPPTHQVEIFLSACRENTLDIVKYFVETVGVLDFLGLVPEGEYFEDPDGYGYVGYMALYVSIKNRHPSITRYLVSMGAATCSKGDFPSPLFISVCNNDYESFSLLPANGVRDFRDKCLRRSLRSDDFRFFKELFPPDGCVEDENYLFTLALATHNLPVAFFLHEFFGMIPESTDILFYKFSTFKKIILRTRTRAANKIRNWWGPLLRRINPEFVMREAEESWNRVEKMYAEFMQTKSSQYL